MSPGRSIAHYRITAKIGEGGMGEVWRATDSKLNRDVAIKILPEAFARDADRMARFEHEAQVLAALNHPNIAAIYGVEDRALVMELVEGPSLAERIAQESIQLDEALPIARQIAEALEYAHEKGIIHRDLKPANVKLTGDGRVKVLDFGLAKALTNEAAGGNPTSSPTLTMRATVAGVIMGTAGYMSPEQARGAAVDRRADIWSFGVILYEMLTGRQMFSGETVSDTLAAVLRADLDWSPLPRDTPEPIRRLLRRCLERDRKRRLSDIGDARLEIDEAIATPVVAPPPAVPTRARPLWWAVAAILFAAIASGVSWLHFRERSPDPAPMRFQIYPPDKTTFDYFALSPDGRQLAFVAITTGGRQSLWIQPLASLAARELPGTEGARFPFWSPDSRFVGFFGSGKLYRIQAGTTAGPTPPQIVCDVNGPPLGGSWGPDGTILYGTASGGIFRVTQMGGKPAPLVSSFGLFPWFLPDGRHFVYYSRKRQEEPGLSVASLDGSDRLLLTGTTQSAKYVPPARGSDTGHLLIMRGATLVAQPIDPSGFELAGDAVPIAEQVRYRRGTSFFSVSSNGILAYLTGTSANTPLVWMDREGKRAGPEGPPGIYNSLALSPDGSRLALSKMDLQSVQSDVWLLDTAHSVTTRFTDDPANDEFPVWSPDGKRLVYGSLRGGIGDLYVKDTGGAAREQELLKTAVMKRPFDWSEDGRFLLYSSTDPKTQQDLWILPLESGGKPIPFVTKPYNESQGQFSPGPAGSPRWIAYCSDESGQSEIYVEPFPAGSERFQISTAGGSQPRWRHDGKELYYMAADGKLMSVDVKTAPRFEHAIPKPLFDPHIVPGYGIDAIHFVPAPDGKRFLFITRGDEPAPTPITIVLNWQSLLKP